LGQCKCEALDCCKEILAGNRPGGCFTRNGWKNMEEKFLARCGVKLVKTQLENKLDNLKKRLHTVHGIEECCHWSWME
jgi:hypothetical protein